jgi:hypothetical protein
MYIQKLKSGSENSKFSFKYFIIAIYPILSIYIFLPGITYGSFVLILFMIYKLLVSRIIKIDVPFFITMAILICINLLQLIINPDISLKLGSHNTLSMLLFFVLIIFLTSDVEEDLDRLYKYLRFISLICALGLLYQVIGWTFFNVRESLFIPGIKMIVYPNLEGANFRPMSFFTEPSHFAIYVLPVFALSLVKKDYSYSLFLLIALIFSTSSLGVIISILILLWHFGGTVLKKISSNRILIISTVFIFCVLFLIVFEPRITSFAFNKALTIFSKDSSPRLLGSLNYISFFNLPDYLFGIGLNQFSYLVNLKLGVYVPNYSNSIVFSFISFGIIGLIVWLLFLYIIWKRIPSEFTSIGIIFLCVCATDQVLFNQNLLYLLAIINVVKKTEVFTILSIRKDEIIAD